MRPQSRCYPLGGFAFHLLGDWNAQTNWAARNSSYVERDSDAQLKGYDDHAREVQVVNPRTGKRARGHLRATTVSCCRSSGSATGCAVPRVIALRARNRDVHTSIDARLQIRASRGVARPDRGRQERAWRRGGARSVERAKCWRRSAIPGRQSVRSSGAAATSEDGRAAQLLDRARYGLYPPGSMFKLVIAGAALRSGGAGEYVHRAAAAGWTRRQLRPRLEPAGARRPDGHHAARHTDLHRGLVVSCNAYFAQLAQELGPKAVLEAASVFQIDVSRPQTAAALKGSLPHAGYGQGQVVVSPLKMARVSGAVAAGGRAVQPRWIAAAPGKIDAPPVDAPRFLSAEDAARLGNAMRDVVLDGTGRAVKANRSADCRVRPARRRSPAPLPTPGSRGSRLMAAPARRSHSRSSSRTPAMAHARPRRSRASW